MAIITVSQRETFIDPRTTRTVLGGSTPVGGGVGDFDFDNANLNGHVIGKTVNNRLSRVGITSQDEKLTIHPDDYLLIADSQDSFKLKKIRMSLIVDFTPPPSVDYMDFDYVSDDYVD
jgi:hypothetical protein